MDDFESDILAWEEQLSSEERDARDATRAWVSSRFLPRITQVGCLFGRKEMKRVGLKGQETWRGGGGGLGGGRGIRGLKEICPSGMVLGEK